MLRESVEGGTVGDRGVLKLAQADRVEGSSITLDDVRQQVRRALAPAGARR